jgi:serine/threonine protein kinase
VTDGHKTVKKGDIVAIKQAQYYTRDARKQASLRNEAKILTELKHKNIVQCFGNFIEHGNMFTVFEYIDGGDLHSYLEPYSRANPKKRVPNNIVCNILQQLLSAVSCLRENKVLQRDLKIQNVMYNEKNGMLKVVDFGLAKKFTKSNQFSTTALGIYALTFSPEMANNVFSSDIGTPYSYAHDMFGVGMMMYSMVVLTDCPWENDSPKTPYEKKQLVQEIKNKPVVLRVGEGVLDGCTEYGQDFLDLVNSCMEKDPQRRPTAVAAMKRLKMYRIKTVDSYRATKIQAAYRKVLDIRKCKGISRAFKQVSNDAKGTGFVVVSEGAFQTENGKNDKVFNAYGVDVEKYREWYRKYQVKKPLLEKAASRTRKEKEEKQAMKLQLMQERADKEALRQALQLQNEKHSLNFNVLARIQK